MCSSALVALAATAGASGPRPACANPPELELDTPVVHVDAVRVDEGNQGITNARFMLRLSSSAESPVVVSFATEDRSARAGEDYLAQSGQVTFDPGVVTQFIKIAVLADTLLEPNESFVLRIRAVSGGIVADSVVAGFISNDERTTFEAADDLYFAPYYSGTLCPAWGDYDGDGDPDLALYANGSPAGFFEIPGFRAAVQGGNYHGVAWCDYDKDGDADIVLLPYDLGLSNEEPSGIGGIGGPPRLKLLRNDYGVFTDVAPLLGMDIGGNGETAVWGDFDADGWPDLFAPFYSHVPPYQSFLFHNRGDGTFESVGWAAGVNLAGIAEGLKPEGAHAVDWNGDGALDLYVASHLFVNDGTGRFSDQRAQAGLPEVFDEGSFFFDFDNDGDFDLFVRTIAGPRLFRNDGGIYTEVTAGAGLGDGDLAWGDNRADVDNDGDLDLVLAGHDGHARLCLNRGDGTFVIDDSIAGMDGFVNMCAFADMDGDGDLDLAYDGPFGRRVLRNRLERVPGAWGSSLRVRVLDPAGRETAFGATVRLRGQNAETDGVQTRVVDSGSGYLTQNDYVVHFGGIGAGPLWLEVSYPSVPGAAIVLNPDDVPALGGFQPGTDFAPRVRVYQDGRFEPEAWIVTGVPGPSHEAEAAAGQIARVLPTPAHGAATFELALARPARVELAILDVRGRLVRRIEAGELPAGAPRVVWNLVDGGGRAVPTGVYLCRLVVDGIPADVRRVPVVR